MKKQIVVIHGGDTFETREKYLENLKRKKVSLDKMRGKDWKRWLPIALGEEFDVLLPLMPNSQNARYEEWKILFDKLIRLLDDQVIFVGHSLGGTFLAKYLSENNYPKEIIATFLVAASHSASAEHSLVDFALCNGLNKFSDQGGKIFLFHSKDDQITPFSNMKSYQKELPGANFITFEDRGHFNETEFPEIVEEIRNLA